MNFEDIVIKFWMAIVSVVLIIGIIFFANLIIHQDDAQKCIKKNGEPYYFLTNIECKEDVNVNIKKGR